MKKICSILLLGVALLLSGCQDDITTANTDIDYRLALGLPIGEANFGLADLLEKVYSGDNLEPDGRHFNFVMDSEGEFAFRNIKLLKDGITVSAGEDFRFSDYHSASYPLSNPGIEIPFKINSTTFIGFPSISTSGNEEKIDSAAIETSRLYIRLNKPAGVDIEIKSFKINFPFEDYETREPIILEAPTSEYNSSDLFDQDCYFDINDFMVKILPNPDPTKGGGFSFDVEIDAVFKGGTINEMDQIGYKVTYEIFEHKAVWGTFTADANLAKTHAAMSFDLLKDLNAGKSEGSLMFEEINLDLTLKNYDIGVPLKITLDSMRGYLRDKPEEPYDKKYKTAMFQNGTSKKYSLQAEHPLVPFTGVPAQTVIILDNKQGRIADLFQQNFQPDMFDFFFSIDISNATGNGFLTKDAKVECDIHLEVPVNLREGSYYMYTDTIKGFSLGEDLDLTAFLDEAELGLQFTNGLPLGVEFSLNLHDATGKIIDSELNKEIFMIKAPQKNNIGEVSGAPVVSDNFRVKISPKTLKQLQNAAYITYSAKVGSEEMDGENTYFQDADSFAVKLKLFAKGGYTGNVLGE